MAASATALAQNEALREAYMKDGLNWCTDDYVGTARTLGMGNAFTALGSDMGSISINPAGSAVAPHGMFMMTFGTATGFSTTQGQKVEDGNTYLGYRINASNTRFSLPSWGATFAINTGSITGLKRVSFGFLANNTRTFNTRISAHGSNAYGTSSLAGSMAANADFESRNWDDVTALAYKVDIIGVNTGIPGGWAAITENAKTDGTAALGGPVNQSYSRNFSGGKNDYIFNVAFNVGDYLFFGANLGIANLNYSQAETISEEALESANFQTGFKSLSMAYNYSAKGTGVYGKFGFIATPVAGLRIGGAIQTPTKMNLIERYTYAMSNSYSSVYFDNYNTEPGSWHFYLSSPWRFNVGAAYTFGNYLILSADYERVDYSQMKYIDFNMGDYQYCQKINETIRGEKMSGNCLGASDMLRVGAEIKPIAALSLRLGYNRFGSATRTWRNGVLERTGSPSQSFCAGIGWSSAGSFFLDIAARYSIQPDSEVKIYDDYNNRGLDGETYREISAPVITYTNKRLNVIATIGWRF